MITRRAALGAGMAFASLSCAAGVSAYGATARGRRSVPSIDALFIDETIPMPGQLAAFITVSGRTLPVVGVRLDAASHGELVSTLAKSCGIVGISSGATLFCLERLAWDHGFRLTGRRQWCASDACVRDVAAFLDESRTPAASSVLLAGPYRPSRADETLHAWTMHKSVTAQPRELRGDAWQ